MAATESRSCRICSNAVTRTHSITLFSRVSLTLGLADRLSRVVDVPVAADDGQSRFICRSCKHKFLSAEPSEPQPRKLIRRIMALSSSFSLVLVEREQRTPVALGHLLTLASVDLWPSALEEGLLIWIAMTVGERNNNQMLYL